MKCVHSHIVFIPWLHATWRARRKPESLWRTWNCKGHSQEIFIFFSGLQIRKVCFHFRHTELLRTRLTSCISHLTYICNDQSIWEHRRDLLLKCISELLENLLLDPTLISVKYGFILLQMLKIFTFYENIDICTFKINFTSVFVFDCITGLGVFYHRKYVKYICMQFILKMWGYEFCTSYL